MSHSSDHLSTLQQQSTVNQGVTVAVDKMQSTAVALFVRSAVAGICHHHAIGYAYSPQKTSTTSQLSLSDVHTGEVDHNRSFYLQVLLVGHVHNHFQSIFRTT
jgi:PBP1b-binding outer membrane lipoprotein LpoB